MKQLSLFNHQFNDSMDPKSEHATSSGAPNADCKEAAGISTWFLYVDGAARNNPGKAGAGIHLIADEQTVCKEGFFLGIKTNNQAEYLALLLGLFILKRHMRQDDIVHIISDSELLVKQMTGLYKIRHPELKPLHALAVHMIQSLKADFMHVPRADNAVADAMANEGIDKQNKVPDEFLQLLKNHAIPL